MANKPDCQHDLQYHSQVLLDDGRNYLVAFCGKCDRQWDCQPINFGTDESPRYTASNNS